MKSRIYNPGLFQGDLKKKNYFEGWYFKHVSYDLNHVWSFIPGLSLNGAESHAFIQIINGISGDSEYVTYPVDQFKWNRNKLEIKIGNSIFTDNHIILDIENGNFRVEGRISYNHMKKYPGKLFSPGIMGWYSFVPFMECKHGIVSVNHYLSGAITINDSLVDFDNGKGYIEKDWGTSFPEAWIWIQANNFANHGTSFTFSVAKIPWRGKYFIGFISFLYYNDRFYLFNTYSNSTIFRISHSGTGLSLILKNSRSVLKVEVMKNSFGELKAPESGKMSRRIKESIDSEVRIDLQDKDQNTIYSDVSNRAGLEVIDKIFEYL
jgi:tocopherol cyclase